MAITLEQVFSVAQVTDPEKRNVVLQVLGVTDTNMDVSEYAPEIEDALLKAGVGSIPRRAVAKLFPQSAPAPVAAPAAVPAPAPAPVATPAVMAPGMFPGIPLSAHAAMVGGWQNVGEAALLGALASGDRSSDLIRACVDKFPVGVCVTEKGAVSADATMEVYLNADVVNALRQVAPEAREYGSYQLRMANDLTERMVSVSPFSGLVMVEGKVISSGVSYKGLTPEEIDIIAWLTGTPAPECARPLQGVLTSEVSTIEFVRNKGQQYEEVLKAWGRATTNDPSLPTSMRLSWQRLSTQGRPSRQERAPRGQKSKPSGGPSRDDYSELGGVAANGEGYVPNTLATGLAGQAPSELYPSASGNLSAQTGDSPDLSSLVEGLKATLVAQKWISADQFERDVKGAVLKAGLQKALAWAEKSGCGVLTASERENFYRHLIARMGVDAADEQRRAYMVVPVLKSLQQCLLSGRETVPGGFEALESLENDRALFLKRNGYTEIHAYVPAPKVFEVLAGSLNKKGWDISPVQLAEISINVQGVCQRVQGQMGVDSAANLRDVCSRFLFETILAASLSNKNIKLHLFSDLAEGIFDTLLLGTSQTGHRARLVGSSREVFNQIRLEVEKLSRKGADVISISYGSRKPQPESRPAPVSSEDQVVVSLHPRDALPPDVTVRLKESGAYALVPLLRTEIVKAVNAFQATLIKHSGGPSRTHVSTYLSCILDATREQLERARPEERRQIGAPGYTLPFEDVLSLALSKYSNTCLTSKSLPLQLKAEMQAAGVESTLSVRFSRWGELETKMGLSGFKTQPGDLSRLEVDTRSYLNEVQIFTKLDPNLPLVDWLEIRWTKALDEAIRKGTSLQLDSGLFEYITYIHNAIYAFQNKSEMDQLLRGGRTSHPEVFEPLVYAPARVQPISPSAGGTISINVGGSLTGGNIATGNLTVYQNRDPEPRLQAATRSSFLSSAPCTQLNGSIDHSRTLYDMIERACRGNQGGVDRQVMFSVGPNQHWGTALENLSLRIESYYQRQEGSKPGATQNLALSKISAGNRFLKVCARLLGHLESEYTVSCEIFAVPNEYSSPEKALLRKAVDDLSTMKPDNPSRNQTINGVLSSFLLGTAQNAWYQTARIIAFMRAVERTFDEGLAMDDGLCNPMDWIMPFRVSVIENVFR